jgi:hypothetical protein
MENHCCTATVIPTNFHVSPLKIYVAFLNVFAPPAVVAAWLESEAFQPGLQQRLVAGSLGQKSLPRSSAAG